jgi:hypothetical protein
MYVTDALAHGAPINQVGLIFNQFYSRPREEFCFHNAILHLSRVLAKIKPTTPPEKVSLDIELELNNYIVCLITVSTTLQILSPRKRIQIKDQLLLGLSRAIFCNSFGHLFPGE